MFWKITTVVLAVVVGGLCLQSCLQPLEPEYIPLDRLTTIWGMIDHLENQNNSLKKDLHRIREELTQEDNAIMFFLKEHEKYNERQMVLVMQVLNNK